MAKTIYDFFRHLIDTQNWISESDKLEYEELVNKRLIVVQIVALQKRQALIQTSEKETENETAVSDSNANQ